MKAVLFFVFIFWQHTIYSVQADCDVDIEAIPSMPTEDIISIEEECSSGITDIINAYKWIVIYDSALLRMAAFGCNNLPYDPLLLDADTSSSTILDKISKLSMIGDDINIRNALQLGCNMQYLDSLIQKIKTDQNADDLSIVSSKLKADAASLLKSVKNHAKWSATFAENNHATVVSRFSAWKYVSATISEYFTKIFLSHVDRYNSNMLLLKNIVIATIPTTTTTKAAESFLTVSPTSLSTSDSKSTPKSGTCYSTPYPWIFSWVPDSVRNYICDLF